jgi:hypothetical protein
MGPAACQSEFERETRVRDLFARRLRDFRPREHLIDVESSFKDSRRRADLRTVDPDNVVRVYEVELVAGYTGLGQALVYTAMAREELGFDRDVRGVLAADRFDPEVVRAIRVMNLGIEVVTLPPLLARAGGIPIGQERSTLPEFQSFSH